jgi:hypothetical protein
MFFLLDIPWSRVVTIMALTWLAAAGPMPAFATRFVGHRTMSLSAPDRMAHVTNDFASRTFVQSRETP